MAARSFVPSPPKNPVVEYGFSSQMSTWDMSQSLFNESRPLSNKAPFEDTCNLENRVLMENGPNHYASATGRHSSHVSSSNHVRQNNAANLRSVNEIPERYRSVFSFSHFNPVQSIAFNDVLYSDAPLVTSAPTGSGKTVLFELAIVRLLIQTGSDFSKVKVIYVAPIKALCAERCEDWSAKFGPLGLKCSELTGDSQLDDYFELQKAHIIMTTPEKWDSMTRKWRDNKSLVQMVQLFLIDEIHQLNDKTRGPTMEAIVCRMKTVRASVACSERNGGKGSSLLRFIAVSATIPNIEDVAVWLGSEEQPAIAHCIDESHRPVQLRRVVLSYPDASTDFKFDLSLNYKLSGVIQSYSDQKPTLVFCATRKGTQQAAAVLVKDARFIMDMEHKRKLQSVAVLINDSKLRELVSFGVGFHHAGMSISDRKNIESVFFNGELPVLFATSTLAMGVNLPAHLVVIKSTMHYVNGGFEEYTESQILQMIGRAGRPQFDTSATAVILTRNSTKEKYNALLGGTQLVESNLHTHLIEHLNAEIVLETITDVSIALDWLKSTFLFTRIRKNPKHYGIPEHLPNEQLQGKLQEMCLENLKQLEAIGLLKMDDGFTLVPTDTGKLMARYYVAFKSMKLFLNLKSLDNLSYLVEELSKCQEFEDVRLRVNEKRVLNQLNKDKNRQTIRFPMSGRIKSTDMKVNCLIQATLGCLSIQEFSLNQDSQKILRSASRLSKCLMEVHMLQTDYPMLLNAVLLHKCISSRLWENSKHVAKQLDRIGVTLSTVLVNAGLTTFDKIIEKNARELELIVNRHPPFGNQLREAASKVPRYKLEIKQVPPYSADRAELSLTVGLMNYELLCSSPVTNQYSVLIIGNEDNTVLFKQKINDSQLLTTGKWHRQVGITQCRKGPEVKAHLVSLHYVGVDVQTSIVPKYTGTTRYGNWFNPEQTQKRSLPRSIDQGNKQQVPVDQDTNNGGVIRTCSHRCLNKKLCGHHCCKNGVEKRQTKLHHQQPSDVTRPATTETTQAVAPLKCNATPYNNNKGSMSDHRNKLHQKIQAIPPSTPRYKFNASHSSSNQPNSTVISQYQYMPKQTLKYSFNNDCNQGGGSVMNTTSARGEYSTNCSNHYLNTARVEVSHGRCLEEDEQGGEVSSDYDEINMEEMLLYGDDWNHSTEGTDEGIIQFDDGIEYIGSPSPPPLPPELYHLPPEVAACNDFELSDLYDHDEGELNPEDYSHSMDLPPSWGIQNDGEDHGGNLAKRPCLEETNSTTRMPLTDIGNLSSSPIAKLQSKNSTMISNKHVPLGGAGGVAVKQHGSVSTVAQTGWTNSIPDKPPDICSSSFTQLPVNNVPSSHHPITNNNNRYTNKQLSIHTTATKPAVPSIPQSFSTDPLIRNNNTPNYFVPPPTASISSKYANDEDDIFGAVFAGIF